MPIYIKDWDGGIGNVIEGRGVVTDQELIDSLKRHLLDEKGKFKHYKYILVDHSDVTKMEITDQTVEAIAGLVAETSRDNPDAIAAVVTYVTVGANTDLLGRISRLHEMFIYPSSWETRLFRIKPRAVKWIRETVRVKFGIDDLSLS